MRQSSCTTQKPRVVTHVTSPAPAAPLAPPQQKAASHSPGTTHQPHVPHNVMFPRLPTARALQKTKAKAKEEGGEFRAKVSRQGLGIEKNNKKNEQKKTKTGQ